MADIDIRQQFRLQISGIDRELTKTHVSSTLLVPELNVSSTNMCFLQPHRGVYTLYETKAVATTPNQFVFVYGNHLH